jgi:hypothetical protein
VLVFIGAWNFTTASKKRNPLESTKGFLKTDFSVLSFRPSFMRVSAGHAMKSHKNQWLGSLLFALETLYGGDLGSKSRCIRDKSPHIDLACSLFFGD